MLDIQSYQQELSERLSELDVNELASLVKDGQRNGGQQFRQRWQHYCESGWAGTRGRHDPSRHTCESLVQFIAAASLEHGRETWFSKRFEDLPKPPRFEDLPKPMRDSFLLPPPTPFGFGTPLPPFAPGGMPPPPPMTPPP